MRRLVAALAVVLLGSTPALAASPNPELSRSAATVLKDSRAALLKVHSVRLAGTLHDGDRTIAISFRYLSGVGSAGTVTVDGQRADIIRVGKTVYVRNTSTSTVWKHVAAGSAKARALVPLTTLPDVVASVLSDPNPLRKSPSLTKVRTRSALALVDTVDRSKIYVSATGAPVPLAVVGPTNADGALYFTGYGSAVSVKAPARSVAG